MKNLPEAADGVLLNEFTARLHRELVDRAIATIRPEIEAAAEAALAELRPRVVRHFDLHADRLLINLIMGEPKPPGRVP